MQLSVIRSRIILVALWFSFFAVDVAIVSYLYFDKWIEQDNFRAALSQLNSLYVTYLGVMIAFVFSSAAKSSAKKQASTPFILALICSIAWNGFVLVFLVRLVLQLGEIEETLKMIGEFGPMLSWVIAPSIGYYFAKSS
jgi:hypothetical protein